MTLSGGANRDQQDYEYTVAAGASLTFTVAGQFINVLTSNQDDFLLGWDNDPVTFAKKGTKRRLSEGEFFKTITIDNSGNAGSLTTRIVVGFGDYDDREVEVGGSVVVSSVSGTVTTKEAKAAALTTSPDVTITASTVTTIKAANTSRREIIVQALSSNAGNIRVGDGSVSATQGIELAPGQSATLTTTAEVSGYTTATGEKVTVTEVLD